MKRQLPSQTLEEQFLSPDARRAPLFETIRLGAQLMLQKAFTAQSYKKGLEQAQGIVAMYQEQFPEAMKCLATDLEEVLTALRFPESRRWSPS